MMSDYTAAFNQYLGLFESYAGERFASLPDDSAGSAKMLEAMKYSFSGGGKRIRPVLCLAFCEASGGNARDALPFALALEMVHTYSLIHDDLPCMDDDDMRRGRPSSHIAFGEANALLAGDALLTLAFGEAVAGCNNPAAKADAVKILSDAAGYAGMIAGQVMDLENEKREAGIDEIRSTDERKTGRLIRAAGLLGCTASGADRALTGAAEEYCGKVGLAFQIVDDILDVTGSAAALGKNTGSDEKSGKSTYVSVLGLEKAKELALSLTDEAIGALAAFGEKGEFLKQLAVNLSYREN